MMILGIETQIVISLWSIGVAVSQIAGIGNEAHRCSGGKFDFNWNYTSGVSILIVEWNVNVTTNVATHDLGGSQPFQPSASYTSRVTPLSDVGITLSSLAESDYGEYGCSVTNMNGITDLCTPLTLFVYDPWSEVLTISKTGGGDSVLLQSSINDDRTSYSWIYKDKEVGSGFKYKAIENGNYTLTLGKRGQCLTGGSSESIIVSEILGCDYSDAELFLGGFSCFLIVLIVSIIMLIILACKMLPDIFGDLKENKKIIIFVVFIVVALSIGLILGLVLKECDQRDLGLGLGLGLGFLLAAALVVTVYVYHRVCNSKKGSQDGQGQDNNGDNSNNTSSTATKAPIGRTRESQNNTGSNTTKNATERVGLKSEY